MFFVDAHLIMTCPRTTQSGKSGRRLFVEFIRTLSAGSCRCSRGMLTMCNTNDASLSMSPLTHVTCIGTSCLLHRRLLRLPKKCVCVPAGGLSGQGPPSCPRGSPKSWPSQKVTEADPHFPGHSRPRIRTSLSTSGAETAPTALQLAGARDLHVPGHSFLKMTSMTMQLCAPPGRAVPLQRHREVSIARTALLTAATRRKRVGGKQTRCLVGATFDDYGTGPSAVGLLTQAVSLVAVTAGAWWAARLASQQVSAVVWNLLLRGSSFIISRFAAWVQICYCR